MTKKEEAIYLLGMLGYKFEDLDNALNLLEDNEFKNLIDFYYELQNYNIENQTASKISLAGIFPTIKIKDGDWNVVEQMMSKCNISI